MREGLVLFLYVAIIILYIRNALPFGKLTLQQAMRQDTLSGNRSGLHPFRKSTSATDSKNVKKR